MARKNVKYQHGVDLAEDVRRAQDALMGLNRQLIEASSLCRAIVLDTRSLKDPELAKLGRQLHSIVKRMKDGPNLAVWAPLLALEEGAQKALRDNAEQK